MYNSRTPPRSKSRLSSSVRFVSVLIGFRLSFPSHANPSAVDVCPFSDWVLHFRLPFGFLGTKQQVYSVYKTKMKVAILFF